MFNLDFPSVMTILINGLCTGGVYGLFASSFTFQCGSLNITDFSFGSWLMLAMYLTFFMYTGWQTGIVPFVILLFLCYFTISFLISRFMLSKRDEFTNMIITMGISLIIQNAATLLFSSSPRSLGIIERTISIGGVQIMQTRLIMLVLSAAILIGFHAFLKRTWTGKTIRAVIQRKEMAYLIGINSDRVKNVAFAVSYVMLSASGIMLIVLFSVEPTIGGFYQMMSFLICIIGGLGNLKGAFFSGLLVGVLIAVLNMMSSQFAMVLLFLIFAIILVVRPRGLFALKSRS
ncbi:MAG: branched-chain amino acid ABC transporter permease [Clostridiales Family XIII bacterium]|jgi:branched-chain amino acid transport system permease protein|nr:branched-chain amino acid ABC transporter permease [Clostridiales Family XIII bacterium]